jgi:DMSO/TMAO reductase YedYZ molybdopterin-dependent catalytic subunit
MILNKRFSINEPFPDLLKLYGVYYHCALRFNLPSFSSFNTMNSVRYNMQQKQLPPHQRYLKKFIIYAALGIHEVDLKNYKLIIDGLVENKLELSYEDLEKMEHITYVKDFHCVTGWSIEDVKWEGIPLRVLAEKARVKRESKWIMFSCLDGYTAPIPIEDGLSEDSILVMKINDKPLTKEQGFPLRPFIPNLYGWKSAKWLNRITFLKDYEDGYWESYGYHERGNVWDEERFKGLKGKHSPRRPYLI